jgi:hypothetical protein
MPKFQDMGDDEMETRNIGGGANFTFTAARITNLGATEYTLANVAVDLTGSTWEFASKLREMVVNSVKALQRSPRSDNLLLRVIAFSTDYADGIWEIHGFKPLDEIDVKDYPQFNPSGLTPLYDAVYSSVGALVEYGADLMRNRFLTNGITITITDGYDNQSTTTPAMIAKRVQEGRQKEKLESIMNIVIGINASTYAQWLKDFVAQAGLENYIDAGDATPEKIAEVAHFIEQSVSSTSQALGTGGQSQAISATI